MEMVVFSCFMTSLCTKEKKYQVKDGMNYCVHIFSFAVVLLVRCSSGCELLLLHGASMCGGASNYQHPKSYLRLYYIEQTSKYIDEMLFM